MVEVHVHVSTLNLVMELWSRQETIVSKDWQTSRLRATQIPRLDHSISCYQENSIFALDLWQTIPKFNRVLPPLWGPHTKLEPCLCVLEFKNSNSWSRNKYILIFLMMTLTFHWPSSKSTGFSTKAMHISSLNYIDNLFRSYKPER